MVTIDELLADPSVTLDDPIELFAAGEFRWGSCQARLYDPRQPDWEQPFLYSLYERTRLSGQRHPVPLDLEARRGLGPLPVLFCGMTNLGPDAICQYLAARAVCVVGEWREEHAVRFTNDPPRNPAYLPSNIQIDGANFDLPPGNGYRAEVVSAEKFHPLGYCFPSTQPAVSPLTLTGVPSNSIFAGYIIFSEAWRTPQQEVLMWLGLAWLFSTFKLVALHGSRYSTNHLTARWTHRFGFRDVGELPYCMAGEPGGELVAGVFSTLLRAEFEERLREVLVRLRLASASPAAVQNPST